MLSTLPNMDSVPGIPRLPVLPALPPPRKLLGPPATLHTRDAARDTDAEWDLGSRPRPNAARCSSSSSSPKSASPLRTTAPPLPQPLVAAFTLAGGRPPAARFPSRRTLYHPYAP
ncbi:hypothetical protein Vretimale_8196 [Volvox reticuliferus]|uniref:Uncharacterized protein n=1 Tax=Volvox reticuliferus TaxID=1737510 RepID=A0A8J4GB27_9CHLO|nr:hypothetical protein Vretifemale_11758 [Volvox reticuliferus]GIM03661.1 hypothetical protein Vretimale_8196 [Volvox reticuliferus]